MTPIDLVFTQPVLEGITIIVDPSLANVAASTPAEAAQEIALATLATALQNISIHSSRAWTVQPVRGSSSLSFDLTPLPGQEVSIQEGWNLTHALRVQPSIVDAEPSFTTMQDDFAEAVPLESPAPAGAMAPALAADAAGLSEADRDWSPRLIEARQAWAVPPRAPEAGFAEGRTRGAGIRVGHPDSGYRRYASLFDATAGQPSRLRIDLDKDFVDDDDDAENIDGSHGLSTASVLAGVDNLATAGLTGVAPAAELVPLRVARRNGIVPIPVLLESGMRRLRDAIYYAIHDIDCHVISISLGWLPNGSLHEAIQEAEQRNVIVCAAAGNYVNFVVWPASYPEVIAVAGCTVQRDPWFFSCRGPRVAVSAPAQQVWIATMDATGVTGVGRSDGTSYAVASVAGVAALWLAHYGRDYLLNRYRGEFTLTQVFRRVLAVACDPFRSLGVFQFGAGIVNARRVLETPLPTLAALRAMATSDMAPMMAEPAPPGTRDVEHLVAAFAPMPAANVRANLAAIVNTPPEQLEDQLQGVGDELLFHILTTPSLRTDFAPSQQTSPVETLLEPVPAPLDRTRLRDEFIWRPGLSERLRERIG